MFVKIFQLANFGIMGEKTLDSRINALIALSTSTLNGPNSFLIYQMPAGKWQKYKSNNNNAIVIIECLLTRRLTKAEIIHCESVILKMKYNG